MKDATFNMFVCVLALLPIEYENNILALLKRQELQQNKQIIWECEISDYFNQLLNQNVLTMCSRTWNANLPSKTMNRTAVFDFFFFIYFTNHL